MTIIGKIIMVGGPIDGRVLNTPSAGAEALLDSDGYYSPSIEDPYIWTWKEAGDEREV